MWDFEIKYAAAKFRNCKMWLITFVGVRIFPISMLPQIFYKFNMFWNCLIYYPCLEKNSYLILVILKKFRFCVFWTIKSKKNHIFNYLGWYFSQYASFSPLSSIPAPFNAILRISVAGITHLILLSLYLLY